MITNTEASLMAGKYKCMQRDERLRCSQELIGVTECMHVGNICSCRYIESEHFCLVSVRVENVHILRERLNLMLRNDVLA